MALAKGPAAPHPHDVFWSGLLAFGGIVTVLGGTLTGLAKPSTGPFDLWTYPATVVAYFDVALALIGLALCSQTNTTPKKMYPVRLEL